MRIYFKAVRCRKIKTCGVVASTDMSMGMYICIFTCISRERWRRTDRERKKEEKNKEEEGEEKRGREKKEGYLS